MVVLDRHAEDLRSQDFLPQEVEALQCCVLLSVCLQCCSQACRGHVLRSGTLDREGRRSIARCFLVKSTKRAVDGERA